MDSKDGPENSIFPSAQIVVVSKVVRSNFAMSSLVNSIVRSPFVTLSMSCGDARVGSAAKDNTVITVFINWVILVSLPLWFDMFL